MSDLNPKDTVSEIFVFDDNFSFFVMWFEKSLKSGVPTRDCLLITPFYSNIPLKKDQNLENLQFLFWYNDTGFIQHNKMTANR